MGAAIPRSANVVRRPNQHDPLDRLRAVPKRRERRGRDAARIDVAGMRRNQRFGLSLPGRWHLGEQFRNRASAAEADLPA